MSVEPQPIRVVVGDDLERTRLTVAFRVFLAIPHLIWFVFFSGGVVFVVALAWVVALFRGSVPDSMHEFLAMYLRYATQLFAYLSFAADPYPGFIGTPGYPFDLEIEPPRPQSRLSIAFRLVIAFPALLIAAALTAAPSVGRGGESWNGGEDPTFDWSTAVGGVLWTVAFLAWFACLARGTMPLGFRNLNVYALRYAAEAWGYALLLTDRYPNADPRLPAEAGFPPDRPVRVSVDDDLSRSRLTVFFRLFLALPHLIWLALWGLLAFLVAIANWFATLVLGRSPEALHRFLAAYIRYSAHVSAYLLLMANPFPGFTGGVYPLTVEIDGPEPQSRWMTAFRGFLAIPAWLVSSSLAAVLFVAGFLGWFYALVTGRMPYGLREAGVYSIRYSAEVGSYFLLLTDRYPFSGPPVESAPPVADEPA